MTDESSHKETRKSLKKGSATIDDSDEDDAVIVETRWSSASQITRNAKIPLHVTVQKPIQSSMQPMNEIVIIQDEEDIGDHHDMVGDYNEDEILSTPRNTKSSANSIATNYLNDNRVGNDKKQSLTSSLGSRGPEDYDSEDDDAISVLEQLVAEEEKQAALKEKSFRAENRSASIRRWIFKTIRYMSLIIFFMIPGVVCEVMKLSNEQFCSIQQTPLLKFSITASIVVFGVFLADVIVVTLITLIRKTPYLGVQFLYYCRKITSPLKWSIATIIASIAWSISFQNTFFESDQVVAQTVRNIFTSCAITAVSYLVEAVLIRLLMVQFHREAFFKRVRKSLFTEYVLLNLLHHSGTRMHLVDKLFNRGKHMFETMTSTTPTSSDAETGKIVLDKEVTFHDTIRLMENDLIDYKPISDHKIAVFVEYIKESDLSLNTGLFKNTILKHNSNEKVLKDANFSTDADGNLALKISTAKACRILARYIFLQMHNPRRSHLTVEDFSAYVSPKLLQSCFTLFDRNCDGIVGEDEISNTLLTFVRDRKTLKTALIDAEYSLDRLDVAIKWIMFLFLIMIYFIVFGSNPQTVLLTFSSFLLACAFAIGSSVVTLLESIIFIFVRHPFDVGDKVVIDGNLFTVTRMSLLTTEAKSISNTVAYFNNKDLISKTIYNLRRSADQVDVITIEVNMSTSMEQLKQMESQLTDYLKKRSSNFHSRFEVNYLKIENSNKLAIELYIQHRGNFQNRVKYRERHSKLILRLRKICVDLGIKYELPSSKGSSYLVNLNDVLDTSDQ